MMFKKYSSIENSYKKEILEKIKWHGYWHEEYIVQEKVHGSNLSYRTTDGIHFIASRRTGDIENNEAFYNYEILLTDLAPKFKNIWIKLKEKQADLEQLTFFGEVIGGTYPHKEVEKDKDSILVQKGIFYSPKNHFYAFDILINNETYLDVLEVSQYFEAEPLLYAKTLFTGNIIDCLNYNNAFQTTIPEAFGLPKLDHNICEGVIVRPIKAIYFNNGSRIILKNKNERWSENKKYNQIINVNEEVSKKMVKLTEAILSYVTENKLSNVISKIGVVTKKDYGQVLGLFNKDIIESFLNDYDSVMDELDKKERKTITCSFLAEAARLVRKRIGN